MCIEVRGNRINRPRGPRKPDCDHAVVNPRRHRFVRQRKFSFVPRTATVPVGKIRQLPNTRRHNAVRFALREFLILTIIELIIKSLLYTVLYCPLVKVVFVFDFSIFFFQFQHFLKP